MLCTFRDHLTPRDWLRPWRDPPGFLLPNCPCCGSAAQMYTLGGTSAVSFPAAVSTADKSNFSNETTAAVTSANLSSGRLSCGAASNPGDSGHAVGGRTTVSGADQAIADKTVFANDTTSASPSANLSQAREQVAGLSERTTKAYFGGGLTGGGGTPQATTDVLTFSGATTSAVTTANLSQARKQPGGLNGGANKGYWAGGSTGSATAVVTTTDKVLFSTNVTSAATTANLTVARFGMFSGSDGSAKGYWAGGNNGSQLSTIDKITFSTDASSNVGTASLAHDRGASGSDGNKLVCLGDSGFTATGSKLEFATDVVTAFGSGGAGNLTTGRLAPCGFTTVGL